MEFSCPEIEFLPIESYVVGYLLKKLPQRLIRHLISVYNGGNAKSNLKMELNASTMEEKTLDGNYAENTAEFIKSENNAKLTIQNEGNNDYDVPVQLKHVIVKPDEKSHEIVNLHRPGSQKEHATVKLYDVDAQPEQTDQGQVQLHQIVAKPHDDEHGIVKLNNVDVTHPNKRERNKVVKYYNASINKPILTKLHKLLNSTKILGRNVKRTSTKSRVTSLHMSDNEIRSN